jgi:hypothetical protein
MPTALNLEGIALTREQGRGWRVAENLARDVLTLGPRLGGGLTTLGPCTLID